MKLIYELCKWSPKTSNIHVNLNNSSRYQIKKSLQRSLSPKVKSILLLLIIIRIINEILKKQHYTVSYLNCITCYCNCADIIAINFLLKYKIQNNKQTKQNIQKQTNKNEKTKQNKTPTQSRITGHSLTFHYHLMNYC